ncbi:MAG TPA: TonB-dependent receptor, partial [Terricaulis sp.]|nr:TonB-dependent receptor [Terricaulis sp.]
AKRPASGVVTSPAALAAAVTIRGLGSTGGPGTFESSVAFFVNGVYLPRSREFSSSLFDAERVEVVRGTQGSLLGKNTSLGAVNLVTRTPGDEFEANVSLSHEFELDSWTFNGGVSIPLTQTLSLRLAGIYQEEGGWVRNVATGRDGGGGERQGARATLVWAPSPTFDATLRYELQDVRIEGFTTEIVQANATVNGLAALGGVPVLETNFDRVTNYSHSQVPEGYYDTDDVERASLTARWDLGGFTLTSQTAASETSGDSAADTDYLPGDYFLYTNVIDTSSFSQEFRLTSPSEQRFRYVAGVWFGTNQYTDTNQWNITFPPPVGATNHINFVDQSTESWSVFAQADFDIFDDLVLSGGLRYTEEEKEADLARTVLVPGAFTGAFPGYAPFSRSRSESALDGLINLSYNFSDDLMVYAAWAQGTKSGGFASSAGLLDQSEYDPEVAQTAEIGVRYQSSDRSLTANATLFSTEVSDYQLVTFNGITFVIANTDLESMGVESQVIWRPNFLPGLRIDWNNTYADASDAITGGRIPFAAKWSGSFSIGYEHSLGAGFTLTMDGGVSYESSQTRQQDPNYPPPSESITKFDASIGLESDAGYAIRLYGRNLTDENRSVFAFPTPFVGPGSYVVTSERPRTIVLELSYRY